MTTSLYHYDPSWWLDPHHAHQHVSPQPHVQVYIPPQPRHAPPLPPKAHGPLPPPPPPSLPKSHMSPSSETMYQKCDLCNLFDSKIMQISHYNETGSTLNMCRSCFCTQNVLLHKASTESMQNLPPACDYCHMSTDDIYIYRSSRSSYAVSCYLCSKQDWNVMMFCTNVIVLIYDRSNCWCEQM